MKQITATATGASAKPIEACYAHLLDVERYPAWYPDGARRVEVLERDAEGVATRVEAVLAANAGPLRREFNLRMALERERPTLVVLSRIADDRGDHELLTIQWMLRELGPQQTEVNIEFTARLEVPMFLPIDPVAREVASGFLQAALASF